MDLLPRKEVLDLFRISVWTLRRWEKKTWFSETNSYRKIWGGCLLWHSGYPANLNPYGTEFVPGLTMDKLVRSGCDVSPPKAFGRSRI